MKKLFIPLFFAGVVGISSCSEDFEVSAPYRNVTVVYGILDPLDTAHYVRIQKAFLDENKSAIDMSKVSDSSFYPEADLNVYIKEYDGNKVTNGPVALSRVNLNNEGFVKDSAGSSQGFFKTPNYAYKFKTSQLALSAYRTYRVFINNVKTGNTDSSDMIGIVNPDSTSNQAGRFYINAFRTSNYAVRFERTALNASYSLVGNVPSNGAIIEGKFRFHYVEKNTIDNSTVRKYVDYMFATYDKGGNQFNLEVQNKNIYSYLRDAIGVAPANIERYIDSPDIFVYAGSPELLRNRQVNLAQTGGLTSDQIKPYYTNMNGQNVLGLVASRTSRVYHNAVIENGTLDSLMLNPITQPLNIKGRSAD